MRRLILAVPILVVLATFFLGGSSSPPVHSQTALPVVASVSPASGPVGGGTSVTITGTGFTGATSVSFGGMPATSGSVVSDTQITVVSPPSPLPSPGTGTVDVTVTTPAGTSLANGSDKFTYTTTGATGAFSGQLYVVAPDGNDNNTCLQPIASGTITTATFACATIQGAVNKTRDHDAVDVLPGVYDTAQPVEVPDLIAIYASSSIASVPTVTTVSAGAAATTVVGSTAVCSGTGVKVILRSSGGQPLFHVTAAGSPIASPQIIGFIMGGTTSLSNPGAIQLDGASYAVVACNTIGQEDLPNGIGVLLRNSDNVQILYNTIHGSSQFPISPIIGPTPPVGGFGIVTSECLGSGHSDDAIIANNLIALNSNAGIFFCSDGTGGHGIEGNTIRGNGRGVVLTDVNGAVVSGNAIQGNYYDGVEVLQSSTGNIIGVNTIESQDGPNSTGILLQGSGVIFPLENMIVGNTLRRNSTNVYILGARGTLIGQLKRGPTAAFPSVGPAGQFSLAQTGNVMTAVGDSADIIIATGNATGNATDSASPSFSQPTDTIINNNSIIANGTCSATRGCAIRLMPGVTVNIDATKNDWGITLNDQIRAELWDKFHDQSLGQILTYQSTNPPPATPTLSPPPPYPLIAPVASQTAAPPPTYVTPIPPPIYPARTTPASSPTAPPPPTAFIDPTTGNYYVDMTICVTSPDNQPVPNDKLMVASFDAAGNTLGTVNITTASNGCFIGDIQAMSSAAATAPVSVSLTDPSGAVTNLQVATGSPLYRPPPAPLLSS